MSSLDFNEWLVAQDRQQRVACGVGLVALVAIAVRAITAAAAAVDAVRAATVAAFVAVAAALALAVAYTMHATRGLLRAVLMTVLTGGKRDLGRFTKLIDAGAKDGGAEGTWILCKSERNSYVKSYSHAVRVVRRRVIKQLTSGGDEGESEEEEEEEDITGESQLNQGTNAGGKTLMRLLAKQTAELETLRDRLGLRPGSGM